MVAKKNAKGKPPSGAGYRRPPTETQFKPGMSGNPKGRPKGSRSVGAILQDILQKRIAVTENGKTRRLPRLEVMLLRLANDAMRSEPPALKLMLSLFDRYGDTARAELQLDDMLTEDRAILSKYLGESNEISPASPSNKKLKKALSNDG